MSTASMHHAVPVPVAAVNVPVVAAPIAPTTSDRHAADHLLTLANFAAATPYSTAGSAAPADPGAAVPAPSAATNDGAAYQMYATYPATVQYHGDAGQQQQQQQQQYFQYHQQQQQPHQYAPTTHAQPHAQTVYSYPTITEAATTQQQYSATTHAQTAVYQYPSSSDAATQQQQAQQPYSQQHQQQYATQQPQDSQQYATQPQQQQHAPQYTQSQPPLPPASMYAHPTATVTTTTSTTTTGALPSIREDVAYAAPPDSWSSRPRTAPTVPLPPPTTTTTAAPPLPSPIEVSSRQVAHLPYEIPLPERRFSTNDVPIGGRLFRTPAASPRSLSISAPSAAYVQGYLPDNPAPAVGAPTSLASSTFIDSSVAAPGAAVAAEASAVSHQQYHHHQQQQQHVAATAYTNAVPATGATYQYAGATWALQQQQPSQQQQQQQQEQHYVYHYPAQHQYVAQSASGTATTSEYASYAAPTAQQQYQQQKQGPDAHATTGDVRGAVVHADMGSLRLDEQQLQQLQQQQQLKQQSSTHSPLATQGDLASTDASPATVTIARTASKKRKRLIGAAGVPAPPSGPSTADVSPADTAAPASFPTSPMPAFAMDPVTGIQPSPLLASPDIHALRSKKTRTAPGEDDDDPARTDPVSLGAPANALHVAWTSTAAGDPGPVTYHQMAAAPPAAVPVDPAATAHMYSALSSSMPLTTPAAVAMAYPMHASQMAAVPPLPPPVAPGGGASSAGSPADRAGDKSDPIPRVQKLRFPGDLYTPRLVRYTGAAKEGLCDLCPQGKFLQLKNSAFWYHKQFYHGISSVSGLPFVEPIERRTVTVRVPPASSKSRKSATAKAADPDEPPAAAADAAADAANGEASAAAAPPKPPVGRRDSVQRDKLYTVIEGLCHQCQQWIPLTSAKRRTSAVLWYRHAHKCHEYEKPSSLHGAAMLVTAAAASSTHPVSYNPVQYATDPATGAAYAVDPAAAAAAVAGGYGMVAQPHQTVGNGAAVMYAAAAAAASTPMDMASAAAAAAMTAMAAGGGPGGASESPTLTLSQQHGGPYHHTEYAVHASTPTGYLQQHQQQVQQAAMVHQQQSMHEHQQHQHQQQTQQQSQQPIELQPQAMYPLEAAAAPPPQLSQQAYTSHPQYHAYVDQQQHHHHHQQQQQHQQLQQQQQQQQQQYQYASQPDPSQLQQSYAQQLPSLQGTLPAQHVPEHQQSQPQAPSQPAGYGASAYPQYATHSGTPGHQ
ncbi:hypothetical protein GGF31_006009 [Allomyces arbusculus]|nr:hypothetical protein GGF31_006009 [Allomyces arbusculus]